MGFLSGILGGGGGTTTTEMEPWDATHGELKRIRQEAGRLYDQPGPEYYPYSTVAPLSPYSRMATEGMARRAYNGSPLVDAAQRSIYDISGGGYMGRGPGGQIFQNAAYGGMNNPASPWAYQDMQYGQGENPAMGLLGSTARGDFLNANPYADAAFNRAAESVGENFMDATAGTNAYFSRAGRSGSAAFGDARNELDESLAEGLGDLSDRFYQNNYLAERQNQLGAQGQIGNFYNTDYANRLAGTGQFGLLAGQDIGRQLGAAGEMEDLYGRDLGMMMGASGMAPGLANQDYYDLERMAGAGAVYDAQNQAEINDARQRWDHYQTGPGSEYGQLDRYASYIYPQANMGGSQQTPYYDNTFGNIAGTGLAIAGLLYGGGGGGGGYTAPGYGAPSGPATSSVPWT